MPPTAHETATVPGETPVQSTKLFCDVVMKGGITGGIVYPKAVGQPATVFTPKNIGGTSACASPLAVMGIMGLMNWLSNL